MIQFYVTKYKKRKDIMEPQHWLFSEYTLYYIAWLLIWSLIGHATIKSKMEKINEEPYVSEKIRMMMHLLITITIYPLELFFNILLAIEKGIK